MKFFGWMQNKLNVKQVNSRPSTSSASHHVKQPREEFSDWPHGLLAIGTFGMNNGVSKDEDAKIREIQEEASNPRKGDGQDQEQEQDQEQDPSSSEGLEDFTPEEVGKLRKELTRLLTRTKKRKSDAHRELTNNLPLDKFLNCPSSLEVDRRISNALCSADPNDKDEDIERTINVILGRCKEISTENERRRRKKKKTDLGKASVSYLLKKIFVCSDGISSSPSPAPSLRDTLQESRMEKFLRMMLHKKIHSQATSRTTSAKKYLQDKQRVSGKIDEEEENNEKSNDGYKWVKTDSDFIVLEI